MQNQILLSSINQYHLIRSLFHAIGWHDTKGPDRLPDKVPLFCPLEALHSCPLLGLTNLCLTIQELLNLMFIRQASFYLQSPAILFFQIGMTFKCNPYAHPFPSSPQLACNALCRWYWTQVMPCTADAMHRWCRAQAMLCIGDAAHKWCHTQVRPHTGDALHRWYSAQVMPHTGDAPHMHKWCPTQAMPCMGNAPHGRFHSQVMLHTGDASHRRWPTWAMPLTHTNGAPHRRCLARVMLPPESSPLPAAVFILHNLLSQPFSHCISSRLCESVKLGENLKKS